MTTTRRDLFGYLAALGGIPLLAKEVETPTKLILDPGEVVRFDSLAVRTRVGDWGHSATPVARIPVTQRAAMAVTEMGLGRFGGFTVEIKRGVGGQPDSVILDYSEITER